MLNKVKLKKVTSNATTIKNKISLAKNAREQKKEHLHKLITRITDKNKFTTSVNEIYKNTYVQDYDDDDDDIVLIEQENDFDIILHFYPFNVKDELLNRIGNKMDNSINSFIELYAYSKKQA